MIDDATNTLFAMFHTADSTVTNMATISEYIKRYGLPVIIYSDRASHFSVNKGEKSEDVLSHINVSETQIKRALDDCCINLSFAGSPQAKGRVERLFQTLQDRLLKRMKFDGIKDIETANKFLLDTYLNLWNKYFYVEPVSDFDAHRPATGYNLKSIFSIQVERTVRNDYTISLDNKIYQLEGKDLTGLKRNKVVIEKRLDGSLRVRFKGRYIFSHQVADKSKH
jgi:hypothetical protein